MKRSRARRADPEKTVLTKAIGKWAALLMRKIIEALWQEPRKLKRSTKL